MNASGVQGRCIGALLGSKKSWRQSAYRSFLALAVVEAAIGPIGWWKPALAVDYLWIGGGGGMFRNPGLWQPFNPPTGIIGPGGALDTANFNLGVPAASRYTVTGVNGQNFRLSVLNDSLRLDLSANYTVQHLEFGGASGNIADVILTGIGHLQTNDASIGVVGSGIVTVDDLQLDGSGDLIVANGGTGTLTIQNGGSVSNATGRVAFAAHQTGTVTVTDADSSWKNSGELEVGGANGSMGTLTIQDKGSVASNTATVARDANANGTVTVTGEGSNWTNNAALTVGKFGKGTLMINAGGTVSSGSGVIGENSSFGGTGTVSIENAGSVWTNSGSLVVGSSGEATLAIKSGSSVSNINGFIGNNTGSTGDVTLTLAGSSWTNTGALTVGVAGTGTLKIDAGCTVSNTGGFIGNNASGKGGVTVTGANAKWLNSFGLSVGNQGTGTLDITAGGFVSSLNGHIGEAAGSFGTVTVTGANSKWLSTTMADFDFNVGRDGNGTLQIKNGGTVESTSAVIGFHVGSQGTATVQGAGSTWTNHGPSLLVGFAGTGTLNIISGGKVSNGNGFIGSAGVAVGNVTVNGNDSMWTNSGEVRVGGDGTGTLMITGGGEVSDTDGFVVTFGAMRSASAIVDGTGSTWTNSGNLQIGGDIGVGGGTNGTLDIRPGGTVTVAQNTVLFPNGVLHLTGGTLDSAGVSRQAGSVFDFSSGTLHVGNFLGDLVNQAGTLAPGHSAGRTSITGNYTQQTGAVLDIEVGGISFGSNYDVVEVSGSATLAGVLRLSLINGFVPAPNNIFTALAAGNLSGVFSNVANGQRLTTADGLGSFVVRYGPGSAAQPQECHSHGLRPCGAARRFQSQRRRRRARLCVVAQRSRHDVHAG